MSACKCGQKDKTSERNFEELEVGCWYLSREGYPVKIIECNDRSDYPYNGTNGFCYTKSGDYYYSDDEDLRDLITKIEPPVFVHMKPTKVKSKKLMEITSQDLDRMFSNQIRVAAQQHLKMNINDYTMILQKYTEGGLITFNKIYGEYEVEE